MAQSLKGKRIAILATDGFEQSELLDPRKTLQAVGAQVDIVAPAAGEIRGWQKKDWGDSVPVDKTIEQTAADDYDALLLPGGVINPDQLRMDSSAVALVRSFDEQKKPIAAICHGPWLLVESGVARGRKVTSWPSVKTDLKNAGAEWVDEQVVRDGHLITSRKPDDIPAFTDAVIDALAV